MTDLFHSLHITHASGSLTGESVDIGWRAWASAAPIQSAGRLRFYLDSLRFWLAIWRSFGQQRVLIQVDDHYLMATHARVFADADGHLSVAFEQGTSALGHIIRHQVWPKPSALTGTLSGREVRISLDLATAHALPDALRQCPAAWLDGTHALALPLTITRLL